MAKKDDEETGTQKAAQIGPRKLKNLLNMARSTKADLARISSDYGEAVRSAVEKDHLNKRAWAVAIKEDKMEPEQLRAYLDALDYYRDELGLYDRAESAPPLDMTQAEEEDEGEEEEEGKKGKGKVHPLPAAAE